MAERTASLIDAALGVLRAASGAVGARIGLTLRAWWDNPLLRHRRRLKPMPVRAVARLLPWVSGGLGLLAGAAWLIGAHPAGRALGAALTVLSLGAPLAPLLAAPPLAASEAARQMAAARHNPALFADLAPNDVTWGLALIALWRLRWPVAVGLAFAPALVIGVLRLDVSSFATWRDSLQALGGAAPSGVAWLLPGGRVPLFRLTMRALSAGLLPWALLPLLAVLGVGVACRLHDPGLSGLAALLGGVTAALMAGLLWAFLSRTPLLAGSREVVRLLLLAGLIAGPGRLARWLNGHNARRLAGAG